MKIAHHWFIITSTNLWGQIWRPGLAIDFWICKSRVSLTQGRGLLVPIGNLHCSDLSRLSHEVRVPYVLGCGRLGWTYGPFLPAIESTMLSEGFCVQISFSLLLVIMRAAYFKILYFCSLSCVDIYLCVCLFIVSFINSFLGARMEHRTSSTPGKCCTTLSYTPSPSLLRYFSAWSK
jgi:hypothetical protein